MLRERKQRLQLLFSIVDDRRPTEDHYRSIVHRMMKCGSCQHQSVDQSHCDANINSLPQHAQHATGLRTMNDQFVFDACVAGRNHKWLAVNDESNMANKTFVQDSIDNFALMTAALRQSL